MADNRPSVYFDPTISKWVYRASALGRCENELLMMRKGNTPADWPDSFKVKFEEGNAAENQILTEGLGVFGYFVTDDNSILSSFGQVTSNGQIEVEMPVGETCVIRCHPDGIGLSKGGEQGGQMWVVEAKLLSPQMADKLMKDGLSAFPYYEMQFSVEMAGTGLPGIFIVGVKDEDGLLDHYLEPIILDTPPLSPLQIKMKVMKIEALYAHGEMGDCGNGQYPCGFYWVEGLGLACSTGDKKATNEQDDVMLQLGEVDGKILDSYAVVLHDITAEIKELEKRKKDVQAKIRAVIDRYEWSSKGKAKTDPNKRMRGIQWEIEDVEQVVEGVDPHRLRHSGVLPDDTLLDYVKEFDVAEMEKDGVLDKKAVEEFKVEKQRRGWISVKERKEK